MSRPVVHAACKHRALRIRTNCARPPSGAAAASMAIPSDYPSGFFEKSNCRHGGRVHCWASNRPSCCAMSTTILREVGRRHCAKPYPCGTGRSGVIRARPGAITTKIQPRISADRRTVNLQVTCQGTTRRFLTVDEAVPNGSCLLIHYCTNGQPAGSGTPCAELLDWLLQPKTGARVRGTIHD